MFATDARKKYATRIDIPCIRGKKIQTDTTLFLADVSLWRVYLNFAALITELC